MEGNIGILFVLLLHSLLPLSYSEPVGTCPPENEDLVTFLTDSEDCRRFYKCEWGEPQAKICPQTTYFNPELNVCDWPENTVCGGGGTGGEDPVDPIDPPVGPPPGGPVGECPAIDGEFATLLPDATNCALFYKCEFGNPVLKTCPEGLEFNPVLSVCDWPENAGCSGGGGPVVTDEPDPEDPVDPSPEDPDDIPTGGGPVGECPAIDGEFATLLPDATNCALFYKCEFGNPVLKTCPEGLEFNPVLSVCDWPENAGCSGGGGPVVTDEPDPEDPVDPSPEDPDDIPTGGGPVGECPAIDGEFATLLPDATNCALFYKCEFGNPVLKTCPEGLEFNPALSVCDWPENAGCSGGGGPVVTDEPGPEDPDDIPSGGGPVGECPEIDGEYATLLPDATNCGVFYKCEFGNPVLIACPEGLEFNPVLNVCDWPENAGCSTGGPVVTDEPDPEDPVDPSPEDPDDIPSGGGPVGECPEIDGEYATLLPDATNCGVFYKCEFGNPVLIACPGGLEFNPVLNVCDWPENAGCSGGGGPVVTDEPDPEEPVDPPTEEPEDVPSGGGPVGECPAIDGEYATLLPDATNCGVFYKCEFGNPVLVACPEGLEFNPVLNVCDWPENAGCSTGGPVITDEPDPEEPVDPPTEEPEDIPSGGGPVGECPEIDGEYATLLPDATNCGVFYKCEFGNPVLIACPEGLEFNPVLNVCDWPENAGCSTGGPVITDEPDPEDPVDPSPEDPDDLPSGGGPVGECPAVDGTDVTFLPDATNCALFYKCESGSPVLFSCPDGLEFNPILNVCDWPENAGCSSGGDPNGPGEVTPPPGGPDDLPSGGGPVGECPAVDGTDVTFLPDATNCALFYKCESGSPVLFSCPDGLEFNPTLNVCDWPENAGCGSGGDPNGPGEVTPPPGGPDDLPSGACEAVTCIPENGEYVTFVPNDTDCTRFCKCDWGTAFEFYCPGGLHFNTVLNVCDWPENAGCAA